MIKISHFAMDNTESL